MDPTRPTELEELEPRADAAPASTSRLTLLGKGRELVVGDFARDVREGLSAPRKRIPSAWLWDKRGSELFEIICGLPEYYPTRSEAEILERHAAEILAEAPTDPALVELGSGSAAKTRLLIEEHLRTHERLLYVPIDISRTMLEQSALELLEDHPGLAIVGLAAEYREGLHALPEVAPGPRLVLWLGSNVGNLTRPQAARFLSEVRAELAAGDGFLLGVDLRKERAVLEAAYDDARGVTAEFNLNVLARINRELGGRFDLERFRHVARWDEEGGRVVLEIESLDEQSVRIDALGIEVELAKGERIHTEDSTKYSLEEIDELARAAGFRVRRRWLDEAGRFSLNLLSPR